MNTSPQREDLSDNSQPNLQQSTHQSSNLQNNSKNSNNKPMQQLQSQFHNYDYFQQQPYGPYLFQMSQQMNRPNQFQMNKMHPMQMNMNGQFYSNDVLNNTFNAPFTSCLINSQNFMDGGNNQKQTMNNKNIKNNNMNQTHQSQSTITLISDLRKELENNNNERFKHLLFNKSNDLALSTKNSLLNKAFVQYNKGNMIQREIIKDLIAFGANPNIKLKFGYDTGNNYINNNNNLNNNNLSNNNNNSSNNNNNNSSNNNTNNNNTNNNNNSFNNLSNEYSKKKQLNKRNPLTNEITPLMYCCLKGDKEVFDILIENSKLKYLNRDYERNCLFFIFDNFDNDDQKANKYQIAKKILEKYEKIQKEKSNKNLNNPNRPDNSYNKNDLTNGFNINDRDIQSGQTLLMLSVINQDLSFVKLFLSYGADPNIQDTNKGNTAIHYAALKANIDIIDIFLNNDKCDFTIKNNEKETVVDVAFRVTCHTDIYEKLVKKFNEQMKEKEEKSLKNKNNNNNMSNNFNKEEDDNSNNNINNDNNTESKEHINNGYEGNYNNNEHEEDEEEETNEEQKKNVYNNKTQYDNNNNKSDIHNYKGKQNNQNDNNINNNSCNNQKMNNNSLNNNLFINKINNNNNNNNSNKNNNKYNNENKQKENEELPQLIKDNLVYMQGKLFSSYLEVPFGFKNIGDYNELYDSYIKQKQSMDQSFVSNSSTMSNMTGNSKQFSNMKQSGNTSLQSLQTTPSNGQNQTVQGKNIQRNSPNLLRSYIRTNKRAPTLFINLLDQDDENLLYLDGFKTQNEKLDIELTSTESTIESAIKENQSLKNELIKLDQELKNVSSKISSINNKIQESERNNSIEINKLKQLNENEKHKYEVIKNLEINLKLQNEHQILRTKENYLNKKFTFEIYDDNYVCNNLTKDILDFVNFIKYQVSLKTKNIESIMESLGKILEENNIFYELKKFGSYATGLSLPFSGLDIVLDTKKKNNNNNSTGNNKNNMDNSSSNASNSQTMASIINNSDTQTKLIIIKEILLNINWINNINIFDNGIFPYISFQTDEEHGFMTVNLSIKDSSHSGLSCIDLTKQFLNSYKTLEYLTIVVKQILFYANYLNNHSNGLNSYSVLLMVIYFFQCKLTQEMSYNLGYLNDFKNIGKLFNMFLNFYGNTFEPSKNILFPMKASNDILGNDSFHSLLSKQFEILIVDPLDHYNNVASKTTLFSNVKLTFSIIYNNIRDCCECSCHYLQEGKDDDYKDDDNVTCTDDNTTVTSNNVNSGEKKNDINNIIHEDNKDKNKLKTNNLGTEHCFIKKLFKIVKRMTTNFYDSYNMEGQENYGMG